MRAAGPHPRGAARASGEDQCRALFPRVRGPATAGFATRIHSQSTRPREAWRFALNHSSTALNDVAETLRANSADWAVAGAVAANNYRDETPTTTAIDVLLALAEGDITDVEAGLHNRGWGTTQGYCTLNATG